MKIVAYAGESWVCERKKHKLVEDGLMVYDERSTTLCLMHIDRVLF